MSKTVQTLQKVNRRKLTSNTQKVAYKLLTANGQWVARHELERVATSAPARVRDLRKEEYGSFQVECKSAMELNKKGDRNTTFYRIKPTTVKTSQVQMVFRI